VPHYRLPLGREGVVLVAATVPLTDLRREEGREGGREGALVKRHVCNYRQEKAEGGREGGGEGGAYLVVVHAVLVRHEEEGAFCLVAQDLDGPLLGGGGEEGGGGGGGGGGGVAVLEGREGGVGRRGAGEYKEVDVRRKKKIENKASSLPHSPPSLLHHVP